MFEPPLKPKTREQLLQLHQAAREQILEILKSLELETGLEVTSVAYVQIKNHYGAILSTDFNIQLKL